MKNLLILLVTMLVLLGGSQNVGAAGNDRGRGGYGPVVMTATTSYPVAAGADVTHLDDAMTVDIWWRGSGTIAFVVEGSNFTALEDPSNLSFANLAGTTVYTGVNDVLSIQGPVRRIRFRVTSCTGDCTTSVKVEGRVNP